MCADAVAHLRAADPYDLIYSVCSVPYLDPNRLLPALANGLKPGGRLVFSALHTNSDGAGPSNEVTARPEILRLPGTTQDHPVSMWVLRVQLWEDLLVQHGLTLESVTAIDSPTADNAVSYRLYTARRPERVPSRPRTNTPPPPNTALGVGVIVYGPDGILLGRHRRRTWELAGGTVEPGETFAEAAIRGSRPRRRARRRTGAGHAPGPGGRRRTADGARPDHPLVRHSPATRGGHRILAVLASYRAAPAAVRAQRPVPDRLEPRPPARSHPRPLPAVRLPGR